MRLGKVLQGWRHHKEVSLRAIAREIGTSPATLCRFENGENVDMETFLKIWHWLTSKAEKGDDVDAGV
jgi:transcriptional regulator with XRE-family HTH domain